MELRNKHILVMGLGLHDGGLGVTRFLVEQGAHVTVTDLRSAEVLQPSLTALQGLPVTFVLGEHRAADFRNADMVIFDSMYSLADSVSIREDWGHSSNVVGVELCQQAGARRLVLFHHEPVSDDETIDRICEEARRLEEITRQGRDRLDILAAYDGLELDA